MGYYSNYAIGAGKKAAEEIKKVVEELGIRKPLIYEDDGRMFFHWPGVYNLSFQNDFNTLRKMLKSFDQEPMDEDEDYAYREIEIPNEGSIYENFNVAGYDTLADFYPETKIVIPGRINTRYIVVCTYSFDPDIPLTLFDSFADACNYIQYDFEKEVKIQKEENGKEIVTKKEEIFDDGQLFVSHNKDYSVASMLFANGDKIEWGIGSLKVD